MKTIYD